MQFVSVWASFLCTGLTLLLTPPTASQEQCPLPTNEDVKNVVDAIFVIITGDGEAPSVDVLFHVHFTCLATVGLEMYAHATVVANFTHTGDTSFINEQQFQLMCGSDGWVTVSGAGFEGPGSLPAMPFAIETQYQCSTCISASSSANYDSDSHCLYCPSECLSIGGGFCTGNSADQCCPFFDGDTDACVDNCTSMGANFAPDENFTCECQISCDAGFVENSTDCSCELTDGCEAAGQPCQNGGTCTSYLSAPVGGPYYTCTCADSFSGQNCTVCQISCDSGFAVNVTSCSCELTNGCEAAGQPCQNGGTCMSDLLAPPYYSCQCAAGSTGQNCETVTFSPSSMIATTSIFAPTPTITSTYTSTTTTTTSTSFATPTTPVEGSDLLVVVLVPVVVGASLAAVTVSLMVLGICFWRKQNKTKGKGSEKGSEQELEVQPSMETSDSIEKEINIEIQNGAQS